MKKKIISLALVICLLAIAVVGGTMAYFTDHQEATNTFTVGSVKIELLESTLHRKNDKASDAAIVSDAAKYDEYLEEAGTNIVPGIWVKKAPYIKNTGKNDAYVRTRLLIPTELFENNPGVELMTTTTAVTDGSITGPAKVGTQTIDGVVYNEYLFTYTEALAPEEMTYWPAFWQVRLTTDCDNEDIEGFIKNGVITADYKFNIIVEADAIQADGFADAAAAFAAFDAQE